VNRGDLVIPPSRWVEREYHAGR